MSKQNRHGARTAADVMRRFRDVPQGVEAAQKAASLAGKAAEDANKVLADAVSRGDFESAMNRVTQEIQAINQKIGTGEMVETDGGTKAVGDSWQILTATTKYLYTFRALTGGIKITEVDGGIYLNATASGMATVTIATNDGSVIQRWTFTIA